MDIAPRWHGLVDFAQEFEELLGPPRVLCRQTTAGQWMTWQAFTDDLSRLHVECCEQRGRTMTLVVMGHHGGGLFSARRRGPTLLEGQPGLRPVERQGAMREFG